MDPLFLQRELKNNNQTLHDFCQDLKVWSDEMQNKNKTVPHKEESKLFNIKEKFEESNKTNKKRMSYSDWEKYDSNKECEKIDQDSDEGEENNKEKALIEKEKGNNFVKKGNWEEAIKFYTKAIEYYQYDPVFYANRALCYLKTKRMIDAENDCTISLKLDNTYVKAYQRRAVARESINKLLDAKKDLLRVLEFEPKNNESKNNLEKLKEKISQQKTTLSKFTTVEQNLEPKIDQIKPETIWSYNNDNSIIIKAIKKPPHKRSKKSLKRIEIKEIDGINDSLIQPDIIEDLPISKTIKIENLKVVEHKSLEHEPNKVMVDTSKNTNSIFQSRKLKDNIELVRPTTSVQFHTIWRRLKGQNDKRYEYFKLIKPNNIPELFKESLESHIFSEILFIFAEDFIKNNDKMYDYLFNFSKIPRFSTISMFFTSTDKNYLWKIIDQIKHNENLSKETVDDLIALYEL